MGHFDFPLPSSYWTFARLMLVFQSESRAVTCIVSNAVGWFFRRAEYEPLVLGQPCQSDKLDTVGHVRNDVRFGQDTAASANRQRQQRSWRLL